MHRHLSVSSSVFGAVSSALLLSEHSKNTLSEQNQTDENTPSREAPAHPSVDTPRVLVVLPSPVVAGARRPDPRGVPRPNRGLPPPHADLSGSRRRSGGDRGRR